MVDSIKRQIKENLKQADKLVDLGLKENAIEKKCELIETAGRFYVEHITGRYTDMRLEKALLEISGYLDFSTADLDIYPDTTLHIMTEGHQVGGHTRAVYNWIEFDAKRKHSVLFTLNPKEVPGWLSQAVRNADGQIIILEKQSYASKAKELAAIACRYEKIVLHIHNWDVVPVLAFGNNLWKRPIYLYNHSSHLFWLGVSIADVVLDFTKENQEFSMRYRGIDKSVVLPLPVEKIQNNASLQDKAYIKKELGLPYDSYTIVSMASDYKYTDFEPYNFIRFSIEATSLSENVYFLLIGADKDAPRWKNAFTQSNGKVIALGNQHKNEVSKIMSVADYYMDSFVVPSFTCILEAKNYAIPMATLKTPLVEFDCLRDITKTSVEEVVADIKMHIEKTVDSKIYPLNECENDKEQWCKILERSVYEDCMDECDPHHKKDIPIRITEAEIYLEKVMGKLRNIAYQNTLAQIESILFEKIHKGQKWKIAIYGTANWAQKCTEVLKRNNIDVIFYIDSDIRKSGNEIYGKIIIDPENLPDYQDQYDVIVIASSAFKAIEERLYMVGVEENKIIRFEFMADEK